MGKEEKRTIKTLYKWVLFPLFLVLLFRFVSLDEIISGIKNIPFETIVVMTALYTLFNFTGAAGLLVLIPQIQDWNSRLRSLYPINKALFLGLLTPGNLGEVSMIVFLKEYVSDKSEILAVFLLDRLITLFAVVLFGVVYLFFYVNYRPLSLTLLILCLMIPFSAFLFKEKIAMLLRRSFFYKKYPGFFKRLNKLYYYSPGRLLANFLLTLVKACFAGLFIGYAINSIGPTEISVIDMIIVPNALRLFNYVGVTPGNLGFVELTAIGAFSVLSVTAAQVTAAYLVCRAMTYLGTALCVILTAIVSKTLEKPSPLKG